MKLLIVLFLLPFFAFGQIHDIPIVSKLKRVVLTEKLDQVWEYEPLSNLDFLKKIFPEIIKFLPKHFPADYSVSIIPIESDTSIVIRCLRVLKKKDVKINRHKIWHFLHPRGSRPLSEVKGGGDKTVIYDLEIGIMTEKVVSHGKLKYRVQAVFSKDFPGYPK